MIVGAGANVPIHLGVVVVRASFELRYGSVEVLAVQRTLVRGVLHAGDDHPLGVGEGAELDRVTLRPDEGDLTRTNELVGIARPTDLDPSLGTVHIEVDVLLEGYGLSVHLLRDGVDVFVEVFGGDGLAVQRGPIRDGGADARLVFIGRESFVFTDDELQFGLCNDGH